MFGTSCSPKRRNTQTSPGQRSHLIGDAVDHSPTDVELKKPVGIDELIHPPPNLRECKSEERLRELDSHATSLQPLLRDEPILLKSLSTHYCSHADIVLTNAKLLKGLSFPDGMPLGPYQSFEEIFSKIDEWAKDINTGGGSFSIVRNSKNAATTRRGATRLLTFTNIDDFFGWGSKTSRKLMLKYDAVNTVMEFVRRWRIESNKKV